MRILRPFTRTTAKQLVSDWEARIFATKNIEVPIKYNSFPRDTTALVLKAATSGTPTLFAYVFSQFIPKPTGNIFADYAATAKIIIINAENHLISQCLDVATWSENADTLISMRPCTTLASMMSRLSTLLQIAIEDHNLRKAVHILISMRELITQTESPRWLSRLCYELRTKKVTVFTA